MKDFTSEEIQTAIEVIVMLRFETAVTASVTLREYGLADKRFVEAHEQYRSVDVVHGLLREIHQR